MKTFAAVSALALAGALCCGAAQAAITKEAWGKTPGGIPVDLYTLTSGKLKARIATYGGTIVSLDVPDRTGAVADIALGFDNLAGYTTPGGGNNYYGTLIGRYVNRIKGSQFTLDGKTYRLNPPQRGNILHGGSTGFDKRVWGATAKDGPEPSLVLTYTSPDGENGFPGTLKATVTYTLKPDRLVVDYAATTDKPTVVNLSNHSYFNLKGAGQGTVLDHRIQINADEITINDRDATATGEIAKVEGTGNDFRQLKPIGTYMGPNAAPATAMPRGYDQNFIIRGGLADLKHAVRVEEQTTGRALDVYTTQPGVHLFTSNGPRTSTGKQGQQYVQHGSFALETQHFANSPNVPHFPSTVLRPGQRYHQVTEYRFSTIP